MASLTKKEKVLNSISPAALVAIVIMNLLLIYLTFETLNTQTEIITQIKNNTDIAIQNQKIGLNVSAQNHQLIAEVLKVQQQANNTFAEILRISSNSS
jgi:cell division protein FtsL